MRLKYFIEARINRGEAEVIIAEILIENAEMLKEIAKIEINAEVQYVIHVEAQGVIQAEAQNVIQAEIQDMIQGMFIIG